MRTQQIETRVLSFEPVLKQAVKDRKKISEKRVTLLADYQVLRALYFKVNLEEIPIIKMLDDLYEKPSLSKKDLILIDNYQNLFQYDEVWDEAREKFVRAQDLEIERERERLGKEVFLVMENLVEKRNQFSFSDNRIWPRINDVAILLKHFVVEKELYQNWSSLQKRYHGMAAKKRAALSEDWRYIVQAFEVFQKQVFEDIKMHIKESDVYQGLRKWLLVRIEVLNRKVGPEENQVIEIDDTESEGEGV